MNNYKTLAYNLIKPYSSILFLNNKFVGFILLLITFINPSVAISGILAVLFTIVFAELIDFKESYLSQGFYIYNSLLVGMGIGYIFTPSLLSMLLIAICASVTFMFSFVLNRIFSIYKIPILSIPFSIVTFFVYLSSLKYSALITSLVNQTTIYDVSLPLIISGFFKSFGTIFFLPNNIAGILMVLLVLYFSRIIVIMALLGYYLGIYVHSLLIGSYNQALYDPYAFNYILVAIALGGVFLLPTAKNFVLAMIGVSISVVLTDAIAILFNYYAIPVFTIPFNITVITFIFTLSLIYYKEFNLNIKETPEESLSMYLSTIFRFGETSIKTALPFSGVWSVYQAFDDEWTHKGEYKYAYDFVIKKGDKSYKDEGLYLHDYFAFGEAILAPINGYVVDSRDDLQDNSIGEVDRINNWGNYIIIKSDYGYFIEISHLMQYSINCKVGDYVKMGEIIAKCGNSGYSPQPHIHLQAQEAGVIGGFTKEFVFSEFYKNDKLLFNSLPKKDDEIEGVVINRSISSRLLFIIDDSFTYDIYENSEKIDRVEFVVKMDDYGKFYFSDKNRNRLYFYNDTKQFYFYSYEGRESHLKWLFKIAPRVPFYYKDSISFIDYIPLSLIKSRLKVAFIELLSTIKKDLYRYPQTYTFNGSCISSKDGSVELKENKKGFSKIEYNNLELRIVT